MRGFAGLSPRGVPRWTGPALNARLRSPALGPPPPKRCQAPFRFPASTPRATHAEARGDLARRPAGGSLVRRTRRARAARAACRPGPASPARRLQQGADVQHPRPVGAGRVAARTRLGGEREVAVALQQLDDGARRRRRGARPAARQGRAAAARAAAAPAGRARARRATRPRSRPRRDSGGRASPCPLPRRPRPAPWSRCAARRRRAGARPLRGSAPGSAPRSSARPCARRQRRSRTRRSVVIPSPPIQTDASSGSKKEPNPWRSSPSLLLFVVALLARAGSRERPACRRHDEPVRRVDAPARDRRRAAARARGRCRLARRVRAAG